MLPGETILTGAPPNCEVCGELFGLRPMQSAAGWYIGTGCCNGPNTRESRYWDTEEETQIALIAWTRGVSVGRRGA